MQIVSNGDNLAWKCQILFSGRKREKTKMAYAELSVNVYLFFWKIGSDKQNSTLALMRDVSTHLVTFIPMGKEQFLSLQYLPSKAQ